jgi:superfamily II DNA or RNA helicase
VNNLFVPCKLGLSATPRRLDGKDDEIFALVDSVKASVSIHSLIQDEFVVRPDFYNISWIDNNILIEVDKEQKGLAKSRKLKQLSAFSVNKYNLLLKLVERFRRENKTFLLFADYIKAAEAIEEIINMFICVNDKNFKIIRVTQKMSSDERSATFNNVGKKNNQYNGLIFAKLGSEGIDIAEVDCVINLSPSKSPVTFAQRTGRAMRTARYKDHCEVYQFVLRSSMEESWSEFSFDEYRQEQFVAKNYVIR